MATLTLLDLSEAKKIKASTKTLSLNDLTQEADFFVGLKSATGKIVDANTALRATCVLACIRILMEDIAAPPLILKRNGPNGPEEATDHPLYRLLKIAPNAFQTSVEVREHHMMDVLLFGRWASWAERDNGGNVVAIHPLLADRLTWAGQQINGDLQWNYASQFLNRTFTQRDLWRGNIMSRTTFEGHSLILLAREAIGLAIAAEEQGARLFNHGIQSDVVVTSPDNLEGPQKAQLTQALKDTYGGSKNAWKALLLEGGLDIKRIGLTAQESQYLEARNYQLADVARIFRIPTVMLGILNDRSNTYASTEQFFLSYEKHCLRPWCNRIEQTISRDLLTANEANYFAKHDLTDLLRADQKTRYDSYSSAIAAGWMMPNEPRLAEGFRTDPRLNIFLRPMNTTEVGQPNPPQTDANGQQTKPNNPSPARKLAGAAAQSIVDRERKWFARQAAGKVTEEQAANFSTWHLETVQTATAADVTACAEYCAWRLANKEADAEAKEKLINVCLEAM